MLSLLLCLGFIAVTVVKGDPATDEIVMFKENTSCPVGVLQTSSGARVDNSSASTSLNRRLMYNTYFLESTIHTVRERIPERVVHAKGTGAFGYFQVTHDLSDICKAKVFNGVGKKTKIAVRFSLVGTESGGSDSLRDNRGFAVKFYTEDGNFDIVGLAMPMFSFMEPVLFTTFVHAMKRNPKTHMSNPNSVWDFLTQRPESLNTFLLIFSDRGVPYGYQYMPGFGIHTFQVVNEHGDIHFVRFHFYPKSGIKNLRSEDAVRLGGVDPDFQTRSLYNDIKNGDYPIWSLDVQVLSPHDVKHAGFNVFDVTKKLPLDKYPLRTVGWFVLNRNPSNNFAQVEQLSFCPGNLVTGISGGPDQLFESRILAYREAAIYRLGTNFNKIIVNKPIMKPFTINRDGDPPVDENEWDIPNYYPNSFHGPEPFVENNKVDLIDIHEEPADNFNEIGEMYANEFTVDEKTRLIENIVGSLGLATEFLQKRAVGIFKRIHPDLGHRVCEGLQMNRTSDYQIIPLIG